MLTCRRASELLSHALDEKLPWPERARLRLHVLLCHCCSSLEDNLRALGRTVSRQGESMDEERLKQLEAVVRAESRKDRGQNDDAP